MKPIALLAVVAGIALSAPAFAHEAAKPDAKAPAKVEVKHDLKAAAKPVAGKPAPGKTTAAKPNAAKPANAKMAAKQAKAPAKPATKPAAKPADAKHYAAKHDAK